MTVAIRYVIDRDTAKDILQESYIRIFQKIDTFEYQHDNATLAWMRQITAREAIRWLKRQKRWTQGDNTISSDTITASHPLFEDDLFHHLLKLPENQRVVFNMYAIEGYSHKEIAQKLQIVESSSRSLLTRARKRLASIIDKNEPYARIK